ncbi:UNVERIFIED_CONTAM: hypothetical protein FKN15_017806 [Acipenser sinensis]
MRPLKCVPANPSFFALRIYSEATRPIVPEDNTDLNGSTADLQVPYQPQGSLIQTHSMHFPIIKAKSIICDVSDPEATGLKEELPMVDVVIF